MLKKIIFLLVFIVMCFALTSQNHSDYMIAAYTNHKNLSENVLGLPLSDVTNDVAFYMNQANLSYAMETKSYEEFINNGVTPILLTGDIGTPALFNDCPYEAEYLENGLPQVILPNDWEPEMKWYKITNSVGLTSANTEHDTDLYSYNYLELDNSLVGEGYVYDISVNPWNNGTLYTQIYQTPNSYSLLLRYTFRITESDLNTFYSNNEIICKVGAKVLYYNDINMNGEYDIGEPKEYKEINITATENDSFYEHDNNLRSRIPRKFRNIFEIRLAYHFC